MHVVEKLSIIALLCLASIFFTTAYIHGSPKFQANPTVEVDPTELSILEEMYNSLDGPNWKWSKDYLVDGFPWNFNVSADQPQSDPCRSHWQGIYCSAACTVGSCNIFYIGLTGYGLSGIMPSNMFNFTKLQFMYLSENNLQGQIPAVAQLPALTLMNLSYNSLDGTIPSCLGKATNLNLLYLSNNRLVGSIPDTFTDLVHLQYLYLLNNQLTGSLPGNIGNLRDLSFLNLGVNHFRGTLPASISQLTKLEQLYLNNNSLSGPFPVSLPYSLSKISLECNKLTGKVPQIFENYRNLSVLKINDNYLTGPPPICLSTLSHLEILQLHLNQFTGPIGPLFDPAVQVKLTNIDLSHNALSGQLPATIFQLPSLRTIAAVKNCFSGTLPDTICQARSLNVISLDGLTSSTACVQYMWDPLHFFNSGYFAKSMRGKIPDCVWALPNLTSLHLAGNSFTGKLIDPNTSTLSASVSVAVGSELGAASVTPCITPTLRNLSLSHNRLSGTIPAEILRFPFDNLDLSYNKLWGHISDLQDAVLKNTSDPDAGQGVAITLKVNRLSGDVPMALENAYGIDVLTGNVFHCKDYSKLPHMDPAYHYYICGSDELNQSMTAFGVLTSLLLLGFLAVAALCYLFHGDSTNGGVVRYVQELVQTVLTAWRYVIQYTTAVGVQVNINKPPLHPERPHCDKYPNYLHFLSSLNLIRRIFLCVAAFALCCCLPVYLLFYLLNTSSNEYSTHTDRYNWISTTVFLCGRTPTATLFAMWMTMCTVLVAYILYLYNVTNKSSLSSSIGAKIQSLSSSGRSSECTAIKQGVPLQYIEDDVVDEEFPLLITEDTTLQGVAARCHSGDSVAPARHSETAAVSPTRAQAATNNSDKQLQPKTTTAPCSSSSSGRDSLPSFSFSLFYRASELITVARRRVHVLSLLPMSVLFLLNALAIITANIVYVYVMLSNITATALFFVQVFMAAFKLLWNVFVVRKLISHVPYNKGSIRMHSLMLVFNSLVAPCFASAVTDSACFRDLIFGSDVMSTAYSYETCLEAYQEFSNGVYTTVCTHYADIEYVTEYNPPFVYNYSCGSSILTSYIPVYIYSYTMLALLLPLVFLALASAPTKYIPRFLLGHIDAILRPQDRTDTLAPSAMNMGESSRPSAIVDVFVRFQHVFKARSVQALSIQHLVILLTFGITSPVLALVICAAIVVDTYVIQTLMIRYVEYQSRCSVFFNSFNTSGSGSNSSGGSVRDSLNSANQSSRSGSAEIDCSSEVPLDLKSSSERGSLGRSNHEEDRVSESGVGSANNSLIAQIYEEERMAELDLICSGTWRCMQHTAWLVYYCCTVFYSALLFDVVGDSLGLESALNVLLSALVVVVFFRLAMSTILTEARWLFKTDSDAAFAKYKAVGAHNSGTATRLSFKDEDSEGGGKNVNSVYSSSTSSRAGNSSGPTTDAHLESNRNSETGGLTEPLV